MNDVRNMLATNIGSACALFARLDGLNEALTRATAMVGEALLAGRKLLCCGNGGSAADSAHLAAELAGRYKLERRGFAAIDLTANHSLITSLINDYPPAEVFARQVVALGAAGDVLAAFTTSGNSENVRLALDCAKERGVQTIAFLGHDGGACNGIADVELVVPSDVTARIQEAHLLLYHTMCEALDPVLAAASGA